MAQLQYVDKNNKKAVRIAGLLVDTRTQVLSNTRHEW